MSDIWYYVDSGRTVGPLVVSELVHEIRARPDWKDTLVWSQGFADWQKAADVSELEKWLIASPVAPPVPQYDGIPEWRMRRWWIPVAVLFVGTIGNLEGRKAMAWVSFERARLRKPDGIKSQSSIELVSAGFDHEFQFRKLAYVVIYAGCTMYGVYLGLENPPVYRGLVGGLFAGAILIGFAEAIARLADWFRKKFPRAAAYVGTAAFWLGILACVLCAGVAGYLAVEGAPMKITGLTAVISALYALLGWGIRRGLTSDESARSADQS